MKNFTQKFYVSDTHFGHEMILGHCERPFGSVREMDEAMIALWNATVAPHDIVYHLGDFALSPPEYARQAFHRLSGRKVLILGNHDGKRGVPHEHLLSLPWDQPPCESLLVDDEGCKVYLSHYAHRSWPGSHRENSVHFYGHSHGAIEHLGRSRDVGVDLPDVAYAPRTFRQLAAGLPAQPVPAARRKQAA